MKGEAKKQNNSFCRSLPCKSWVPWAVYKAELEGINDIVTLASSCAGMEHRK